MDYTAHYMSPIGGITLASDGKALVGLWFDGQKYFADVLDPVHEERQDLEIFAETRRWLDIYFCGENPDFLPNVEVGFARLYGESSWKYLTDRQRHTVSSHEACTASQPKPSEELWVIIPCRSLSPATVLWALAAS